MAVFYTFAVGKGLAPKRRDNPIIRLKEAGNHKKGGLLTMKRLLLLGIVLAMFAMFVGCATGSIERYELLKVTNNPVGSKVGTASLMSVTKFGTSPAESTGEHGGIYQAAKNGGITNISIVERRETWGKGIYKIEVVVYGD